MSSKLTRSLFGFGCFTPILGFILLGYLFSNRSFAGGIVALVICLVIMLFLVGFGSLLEQKQKEKQLEFMNTYNPDQFNSQRNKSFTSCDLLTKIAIDEMQKKVYIWMPDPELVGDVKKAYVRMPYIIQTYNYSDLLAVNLKENNRRTASVHRDTHFTHFILNKLAEDDTRKNSTSKPPADKVSSMDLEVVVDDNKTPRHLLRFYHAPYIYIQKNSVEYNSFLKESQQWFKRFKNIIEQQNDDAISIERPVETIDSPFRTNPPVEDPINHFIQELNVTKDILEGTPEVIQDTSEQEQPVEKQLSYFEQIVEKNRRQLRGDSKDDPDKT